MPYEYQFEKLYGAIKRGIESKENFTVELDDCIDMDSYVNKDLEWLRSAIKDAFISYGCNHGRVTITSYITEYGTSYKMIFKDNDSEFSVSKNIIDTSLSYLLEKRIRLNNFKNQQIKAKNLSMYGYVICPECKKHAFIDMESKFYKELTNKWRNEINDRTIAYTIDGGTGEYMKFHDEKTDYFPPLLVKCNCGNLIEINFPIPQKQITSPLDYIMHFEWDELHSMEFAFPDR